ncbi:MAG: hypothetical protein WC307_00065 [Candidatus Nanoarchaeia archaeon]
MVSCLFCGESIIPGSFCCNVCGRQQPADLVNEAHNKLVFKC